MLLSLDPELRNLSFQATVPTQPSWPANYFNILLLTASQICKVPELVPTANRLPYTHHETLVTKSLDPKSYNFVTLLVTADHK